MVRVLLDENLPIDLALELTGHEVQMVSGLKWTGITNGELLTRARGRFDVLVTMDQSLPFQQNLQAAAVGVVILQAPSHRLIHLRPLMPEILAALADPQPGELLSVGTRDAP